jgi:hypothetical protein
MKKKELSDKTLITYNAVINGILRDAKIDDDDDGDWIKKHWDKILDVIESSKSVHSKKNRYAVLKVWCDLHDLPDKYSDELQGRIDKLVKEVNDGYATNVKSEKIEKNWVSVQELKSTLEILRGKVLPAESIDTYNEYRALVKYLMLKIHIQMPLRNDLACAKIYLSSDNSGEKRDKSINQIIINKTKKTGQLILNDYKTSATYGSKLLEIPTDITKELIKWYPVIIRMSPHRWLIPDRDDLDKCISRVTYTKLFNSIFEDSGKKVSTTQIRRTIVSDLYKVDADEYKKKEELANVMSHSVSTAGKVYAKAN